MKKKISLKWKIFGSFLIFTGILLGLLWVLQILCLNDFYVYVKRKEVKEITENARKLVGAEDSDDLSEALETLALDNGVSLLVTDAGGTSLYSAQYNPRGTMNTLPQDTFKELYAQAQASGGETEIEYTGSMQLEDGMSGQMPPADPGQTKDLSERQDTGKRAGNGLICQCHADTGRCDGIYPQGATGTLDSTLDRDFPSAGVAGIQSHIQVSDPPEPIGKGYGRGRL